MSLPDDLDRVEQLVAAGTDEQRAWFAEWRQRFVDAADRGDDRACEDLSDILILYERTGQRSYSVEELIDALGLQPLLECTT
ncbi:MAG: hypothetical protein WKF41_05655 [Gaiellaceae bacterium]